MCVCITHIHIPLSDKGACAQISCIDAEGQTFEVSAKRKIFRHTYDNEEEFARMELHPMGRYHLQVY